MEDMGTPSWKDEIITWAYSTDEYADQDWDLEIISSEENYPTILSLADDQLCGHRDFFLRCLYKLVGYCVVEGRSGIRKNAVEKLVIDGAGALTEEVKLWSTRSAELLKYPKKFNYAAWCEAGLAGKV